MINVNEFYRGKRVLITGHTGFKGSWLCELLVGLGAEVIGYALRPETQLCLYELAGIEKKITSLIGDIRDYKNLEMVFEKYQPEIVFHLAAQPIVRESYQNPRYTYETNVMGTVNVLECIRKNECVKSVVNVTTDKVYFNKEWEWAYRENEELNGFDPYSNSKSCSELVTSCYRKSFFADRRVAISTARAGNVIGGGDFSKDRIIPDCVRAVISGEEIRIRNPKSIRPYQYVLEPLYAYLLIAAEQYENEILSGNYNVGPNEADCINTEELVKLFVSNWGNDARWTIQSVQGPHEATYLKLDCMRLKNTFDWNPTWNTEKAVQKTVEWTKCWERGDDVKFCMDSQIQEFLKNIKGDVV